MKQQAVQLAICEQSRPTCINVQEKKLVQAYAVSKSYLVPLNSPHINDSVHDSMAGCDLYADQVISGNFKIMHPSLE
jgi:hypothetical protein